MEKFEELQEKIQDAIFCTDDPEILAKILEYALIGKEAGAAAKKFDALLKEKNLK